MKSTASLASLLLLPAPALADFYLWSALRWTSTSTTEDVFIFTNESVPICDKTLRARGYERRDDVSRFEGVRIVGDDVARADVVEFNVYSIGHYAYVKAIGDNLVDLTNQTVGHCSWNNAAFNCENISGVGVMFCTSDIHA